MNFIKSFFGNFRTRIWFIVTVVMAALILAVLIATSVSSVLYDSICMVFGYERYLGREEGFYYDVTATSKEDTYKRGNELTEKICEEGFVLLKNENALPLGAEEKKISVFGKNSVNLVYGGSGSGGGNFAGATTIYDSLASAGFEVNPVLKAFYENDKKSGEGRPANPAIEDNSNATLATGETPQSSYTQDIKDSYLQYNDVALIVISRIGGEGNDLPRVQEGDPDRHYLETDKNEDALIEAVKNAGFGKVIVVINASTTMEVGDFEKDSGIDACISIGGPGYSGINALGRILNGDVTPSGKTVDTWATDFTQNPTYMNFSNNGVAADNSAGIPDGASYVQQLEGKNVGTGYYFVDYEENIYVGYRYYETRGEDEGESWYEEQVVYPFGYGLSYTSFDWEIVNADELSGLSITDANKKESIEIEVKVTNTGAYTGKDVIELYCTLPEGKVEKSSVVLGDFAKTPLLYPTAENAVDKNDAANGEDKPNSAVITLSFDPYYIASYDYSGAVSADYKGYLIESGEYGLSLRTDIHTEKAGVSAIPFEVGNTIKYDVDPVTGTPVVNRFDDADDELDTLLSRTDWESTMPTTPNTRVLSDETGNALRSTATNNPNTDFKRYDQGSGKVKNAFLMRGVPYDDDNAWEEFIDALTFEEMKDLYNRGAFQTYGLQRFNLPKTTASDGPVGFTNFISDAAVSAGNVAYASEYVLGQTWSEELAQAMGESVGEEGIYGDGAKIPTPYTGWYAPGMNLHRSPFGGRNFEYFSEDPYLTGMLAAAEIRGAQSKGVIPYMKHFALNEQETHRDDNGVATWSTEQAIRELYLRPFEIAVKTANAKGVMSSFNRIGTVWTGGDYRLLTEVLRNEWGFEGAVICDFNVTSYMSTKQMIYAGGDLNLTTTRYWTRPDANNAGDVAMLRRAAKNNIYTVVNSNAMNGVDENTVFRVAMPIWQIVMILICVAIIVGLGAWGFFEIRRMLKRGNAKQEEKENTDKVE